VDPRKAGQPGQSRYFSRRLDVPPDPDQPGLLHPDTPQRASEPAPPARPLPDRGQQPASALLVRAERAGRLSARPRPAPVAGSLPPTRLGRRRRAGRPPVRFRFVQTLLRQPGPVQYCQQPVDPLQLALSAANGLPPLAGELPPTPLPCWDGSPLYHPAALGRADLRLLSRHQPAAAPALAALACKTTAPATLARPLAPLSASGHTGAARRAPPPRGHAAGSAQRRQFF